MANETLEKRRENPRILHLKWDRIKEERKKEYIEVIGNVKCEANKEKVIKWVSENKWLKFT